jgi:hypothetical protein
MRYSFVETPRGIFELKYFFTPGIKGDTGNVSTSTIRERVRAIIRAESPRKPVSDQMVTELLRKSHIIVARRTVTKYRKSMGILPASLRRKGWGGECSMKKEVLSALKKSVYPLRGFLQDYDPILEVFHASCLSNHLLLGKT